MVTRSYDLFGLTVASAFAIPWAPETEAQAEADVSIRRAGAEADGSDGFRFEVPNVARYRIVGGREIIVDPMPGASEQAIRLYLLGSALGVLLHQRGLLVLHANAIVIDGAAVLFMGPSGAGKSTLAAWFAARGYPVLTDDICAVEVGADGKARVLPGLNRLRLSDEASERLAIDMSNGQPCPSTDKVEIGMPRGEVVRSARLSACYALTALPEAEHFNVAPLAKMDAVEALMANTYRGHALPQLGGNAIHFESCMKIVARTRCFEVSRAKNWIRFDTVAEAMLAHARETIRRGSS